MEIESKSYTLRDESGNWLGQIVLTSDGMFASVTDWGNLSFAWRRFTDDPPTLKSFQEFLIKTNTDYFASKMTQEMSYIAYSKQVDKACGRFAEKILPALKKVLKEELGII